MAERVMHNDVVPIDNLSISEAGSVLEDFLDKNKRQCHIVPLSIAMYLEAQKNETFREVLHSASLVFPESTGLALFSQFTPQKLFITPGGRVIRDLVEKTYLQKKSITLFGTNHNSREKAKNVLSKEHPGIIIYTIDGEYSFGDKYDSERVVSELESVGSDLVIMAANEIEGQSWIYNYIIKREVNIGIIGNFGQIIDVWAGSKKVPPRIMRENGIGWLMRLIIEDKKRRKRYLKVLLRFAIMASQDIFVNNLTSPAHEETS